MPDDPKTYTQDEVDALIAERNKNLEANRNEALGELKKARAALKQYDGVDPEEFARLKTAAEEAERKKAAAEGDFKSLEKQLVERHQKELESEKKRTSKALAALEKRKVAKLTEALSKAGADPDNLDLLVLRGSSAIRLRETEEDWDEFVADEHGNQLVADGKGTPMDVDTFVEQVLKPKYSKLFYGSGSSGGGATRSNASSGGRRVITPAELTEGDNVEKLLRGEVQMAQ